MIPQFDARGYLPEGVHDASWDEFIERYAITAHRRSLAGKLALLVRHLKSVGCSAVYVDGSFVTDKEIPNDYDACWDTTRVKVEKVDRVPLDFSDAGKAAMAAKYGGDIRPGGFFHRRRSTSLISTSSRSTGTARGRALCGLC